MSLFTRSHTPEEILPPDLSPEAVAQRAGLREIEARQENISRRSLRRIGLQATILGLTVMAGVTGWKYFDRSGEYEHFAPSVDRPIQIDNSMRFGSWNMHGQAATRTGQINKLLTRYHLDALALQEVTADDAKTLHRKLPSVHVTFVEADLKQHILDGGYGNALLTRQPPQNVQTRSFAGTALVKSVTRTIEGAGEDIADGNGSFSYMKAGMQENRAALAETIKAENGGKLTDVRIMTGHIAGVKAVHQAQFEGLLSFIKDNIHDGPTIFCGDLNTDSSKAIPALVKLQMITPETSATSLNSGRTIDHCSYYDAGVLGLGEAHVVHSLHTDHYPLVATWNLKPNP